MINIIKKKLINFLCYLKFKNLNYNILKSINIYLINFINLIYNIKYII